ncbi:MAG: L,D-transpeptidase [Syntrophobacteraceae bacterium]|jgi:hypothetical protein|nr:L,D-transpeptidase [Syntrophobacteraceae bacterium]
MVLGALILLLGAGCGSSRPVAHWDDPYRYARQRAVSPAPARVSRPEPAPVRPKHESAAVLDTGLRTRVITDREIQRVSAKDPDLSPSVIRHILSRINAKAAYYIEDDIRDGRPLIVPNDLRAYKKWSPLDPYIPELGEVPKFILLVKDEYFLGWYEEGRLVGDSHICVGKKDGWTRPGVYTVKEKDADHISRSYTNAYGEPAPMPWALRIYEHVWIHAGDITQGNCSRGCINLPVFVAPKLFAWAEKGTAVMIVDSLDDVEPELARNRSNCLLFARSCRMRQAMLD